MPVHSRNCDVKGKGSAILQTVEKLAALNPEQVEVVRVAIAQIENPLAASVALLLKDLADKGSKSNEAPPKPAVLSTT